ncbi:hypothetical protein EQ836_25230 [Ectopseudomonas mendocina]|jgi:hypothetical protein|uniref:Uncharacterized protein n=1 Tax=Ectopseudomonas mendocina TaxID=300 RepID=A0ABD7RNX9_ECTME|nr:hypothetical protein [Pseudomonas mendocina]TRO07524.1 hypothetical protein EQ829_25220 [Pseudomonas mendocina]TRO10673.1 hypothetical protein EQ836_25230 [Pseudomonas mendocina]
MQQALAEPDTLDGFTWSSLMDIAKRILAAESGIFIAASADLPHEVATEIAVTGAPMIHVGHDQDADRVIEEALIAAGIAPRHTLAAGLAELSDALQRPIVLLIEAVERYATDNLLYALKAARDELNSSAHHGLRLALFGTDTYQLRALRSHPAAAFYYAEYLDISTSLGEARSRTL